MQVTRHFSLAYVFLMPLVVSLLIVALTAKNYFDAVGREIDDEYGRVHRALARTTKVLSAIDYSFSNYSKPNFIWLVDHNRKVDDELCQMWPIDALLRAEGKGAIPAIDINYMLVGGVELCDPDSALYQRASSQVSLAPLLSFLHDIDSFLLGIHYIDSEGYVMSSPDTYAKSITSELLDTIKARPFWQITAQNRDLITINAPVPMASSSDMVMSLSMPVFNQGEHQGMLSLDLSYHGLLQSQQRLVGEIGLYNLADQSPPETAIRIEPLNIEGLAGHYRLYYRPDVKSELFNFFYLQRYGLLVAAFVYVFSVTLLIIINMRAERHHFKQLAAKDPMTGLLNRRGLESYLDKVARDDYLALAVFDIDNFKAINDTYGHDVGDQVIIYMADKVSRCIRNSDAAARIGGEEFVIFMTSSDIEPLKLGLQRVLNAVRDDSTQVLESGFTISGGVEIVNGDTPPSFERLFKAADEKLYYAKTHGKNQIVF
ncbi:diguanylate cyclase [Vibrio sp. JPW-9-11-11]|nr:sensor domain-containing diguanylate cyclase [Vibrio sp. JPW-9-11-11]NVD07062.1 diguanylate cyclase [Vibrio sp. JPW-9-11-11]